jgi:hypothetical protein
MISLVVKPAANAMKISLIYSLLLLYPVFGQGESNSDPYSFSGVRQSKSPAVQINPDELTVIELQKLISGDNAPVVNPAASPEIKSQSQAPLSGACARFSASI